MATTYRHIGKRMPRKDARDIVTGASRYINDIKMERMLFGKVLRSPYPHANIKSIDTSRAEALKGDKAILAYWNLPGRLESRDAPFRCPSSTRRCVLSETRWPWSRRQAKRLPRKPAISSKWRL